MINLLPPARREEYRYAKLNRVMMRYLRLVIVVLVILGAILGATWFYLGYLERTVTAGITSGQASLDASKGFVAEATDASQRLTAIKALGAAQTRFSSLLDDLAATLPAGVSFDAITLTGNDTQPIRITASGPSYNAMLAFRDSLARSARVSGVDLEAITKDETGYHASVTIGFKKGQAK